MAPYLDDMDFAYFAVHLGWTPADYEQATPVQLAFIRKEIERKTVEDSELASAAAEVAIKNTRVKRRLKLWAKPRKNYSKPISKEEEKAIKKALETNAPWTPWKGVRHG